MKYKQSISKFLNMLCFLYTEKHLQTTFAGASLCWHLLIFPGSFPPSIFSASELNFRVRYGNGWTLAAINTNCLSLRQLDYYSTCHHVCQVFFSDFLIFLKLHKRFQKITKYFSEKMFTRDEKSGMIDSVWDYVKIGKKRLMKFITGGIFNGQKIQNNGR